MYKAIIDFSKFPDVDVLDVSNKAVKALTLNTTFKFTTQLTDTTAKTITYEDSLAAIASGNTALITKKNEDKAVLVVSLRVLATEVNLQAEGNLGKLQTSGFPLAKEASHQIMTEVENFKVSSTNIVGNVLMTVDKPTTFSTHGTVFAYWDPAVGPAPVDINKWFQRHSNGNSITLTGFMAAVEYPFTAAYKGIDTDALVWCAVVNKILGN